MDQVGFALSHYFAIGLLALVSYLFGRRLTWRLGYDSFLEELSFSVALGLGVIAYLVFFLGLLGWLYTPLLLIVLLVGSLACYPVWARWPLVASAIWRRIKSSKRRSALIGLAAILVSVLSLPIWVLPLYPPTAFDATSYHLASAKIYAQNHGLVFTPHMPFVVSPQTNQMLFTLALLLYDDITAQLFQFLIMTTMTTALIAFGRRFFSLQVGLWSAALLLASPLVIWVGIVAYVDISLMLYSTMAVYAFWNWLESRGQPWLVLAGIFCGLAVSIKYPALFLLAVLGAVSVYVSLRDRKYAQPVVFGSVAILVVAPWLARNFYYTRNPVYPFFYKVFSEWFGYGLLRPEHYQWMFEDIPRYGVGSSLHSLVTLPWHLVFNQTVFHAEASLSSTFFYTLPILVIVGTLTARIRGLMALAFAHILFWFFSIQVLRYLAPVLPLLSIAAAAALDRALHWLPFLRRLADHKLVTAFGFVLLIYPGWMYALEAMLQQGAVPVTQQQRDSYITARLSSYPIYKSLNDLKGRDYTLYAMYDPNMAYFVDGLYMGQWFGLGSYSRITSKLADGQALYGELKSMGANYFLVRDSKVKVNLPQDEAFRSRFRLINARVGISLYELAEKGFQVKVEQDLLQNRSFEDVKGGWPNGWGYVGSPVVDASGRHSYTGTVGVRCTDPSSFFFQVVPVSPGSICHLSYMARATEPGQKARLQVNWSNARGEFLSVDWMVVEVESNWKRFETNLTVPQQAASAVVYASPHERSSVWFDDFSFAEVKYQPAP